MIANIPATLGWTYCALATAAFVLPTIGLVLAALRGERKRS